MSGEWFLSTPSALRARRPCLRGTKWGRVRPTLHATRCGEGGGDSREDGDYYVEDFTPESVVVEGSHFVRILIGW